MRLLQSLPALALLSSLALCACGQSSSSSAPSGGHEAATASAAIADRAPPAHEAAALDPAPAASIALAPAASAASAPAPSALAAAGAPKLALGSTASPTVSPTATAAPSASAVDAAPTAAPTADPKPIVEVLSPKIAEGSFNTWMQSSGRYTAGQQGNVQVVLVAKGEFHCNDKYPYKFKLGAPSAGVTFPQPVVRAEGMRVAPERSIMTVPFVPSAPGDARVSGTFSFSVCSATSCQIETRELALTVKVD